MYPGAVEAGRGVIDHLDHERGRTPAAAQSVGVRKGGSLAGSAWSCFTV
jgi:hypothetical protein